MIRLTADKPGVLSFTIKLDRPERFEMTGGAKNPGSVSELQMTGRLNNGQGGDGISYAARVRVVATGGRITTADNQLKVSEADAATILFAAETDYHGVIPRDRKVDDPAAKAAKVMSAAGAKPYRSRLADHIADHKRFFDRVAIKLAD